MKAISPAMAAHLDSGSLTLARCWKVTRLDGMVFGFTECDQNIIYGGTTYYATSGVTASAIVATASLAVDNLNLTGVLASPLVLAADLNAGLWDYAAIEQFTLNYNDLSMGIIKGPIGKFGQFEAGRTKFTAELRGPKQAFTRNIGQLYSPGCRADLGDARCKVDITVAPFHVTGTLTGVGADNRTLYDSSRTEPGPSSHSASITGISQANPGVITAPSHGFSNGQIVLIYGVNGMTEMNGVVGTIASATSNTFVLQTDTTHFTAYASGGTATSLASSGYFDHGKLTFTSGLNTGLSMEVKNYAPGMLVLELPMPYRVALGDGYSLTAGCNKIGRNGDCLHKFNNYVNFRGEEDLPGADKILEVGGR